MPATNVVLPAPVGAMTEMCSPGCHFALKSLTKSSHLRPRTSETDATEQLREGVGILGRGGLGTVEAVHPFTPVISPEIRAVNQLGQSAGEVGSVLGQIAHA